MKYKLVEKKNHLAVHGIFETKSSAERFLIETVPVYVSKKFYMDKTLTANDFEVIPKNP